MSAVLIVEDSAPLGRLLSQTLTRAGHASQWVATVAEAREAIAAMPPDVVLLDLHLRDGGGVSLVDEISGLAPDARVIGVSGETPDPEVRDRIHDFLLKPVALETLLGAIGR